MFTFSFCIYMLKHLEVEPQILLNTENRIHLNLVGCPSPSRQENAEDGLLPHLKGKLGSCTAHKAYSIFLLLAPT